MNSISDIVLDLGDYCLPGTKLVVKYGRVRKPLQWGLNDNDFLSL